MPSSRVQPCFLGKSVGSFHEQQLVTAFIFVGTFVKQFLLHVDNAVENLLPIKSTTILLNTE